MIKEPTPCGLEVLQLLAEGFNQKEAAEVLGIKPHTVARRMENLRNQYSPTNESLMAMAVVRGWVKVDQYV